jgi:DNA polymerase zeta
VFVHLPGRSKDQAFDVGQQIAAWVTQHTPSVIELKLEKVYMGCILQAKKRYAGYRFEAKEQALGHLDAKGIEMVRRDQCGLVTKVQEQVLRLLFATRDLSAVRQYVERQWRKVLEGGDRLTAKDFVFAKEVCFGEHAQASLGEVVAAAAVEAQGRMAAPPHRWRVPYLVVARGGRLSLRDRVVAPGALMRRGSGLHLDARYYVEKCLNPALHRLLALCGVSIAFWYRDAKKPLRLTRHITYPQERRWGRQTTLDAHFTRGRCELCGSHPQPAVCPACLSDPAAAVVTLSTRLKHHQRAEDELHQVCVACVGGQHHPQRGRLMTASQLVGPDACESVDCPVLHERLRVVLRLEDCHVALAALERARRGGDRGGTSRTRAPRCWAQRGFVTHRERLV